VKWEKSAGSGWEKAGRWGKSQAKSHIMLTSNRDTGVFKNKHLLLVVTYAGATVTRENKVIYKITPSVKPAIHLFFQNLLALVAQDKNIFLVIIDNGSDADLVEFLRTIRGERILLHLRNNNVGKARSVNDFIAENIGDQNLPGSVWSIDPDVIFDSLSFYLLAEAVCNLPQVGMIGMRYKKNACNPEVGLYFAPRSFPGKNGKTYSLVYPFMANVAGPIFAISGKHLKKPLNYHLFPMKETFLYGRDDAAIYDHLKKSGLKNGYLNGTLAIHLRSGTNIAEELADFINKRR
jgi:hypothetical protein